MVCVGAVAAVAAWCSSADAPGTVSNCLPSTPAPSHSADMPRARATTMRRTRGERVTFRLSARILKTASRLPQELRSLDVGREEGLDRQLGDGDVDRGAEHGHGAEEPQHAVA